MFLKAESLNNQEALDEQVVQLLREKNYVITTAESCTGGLLAGSILNVSGASQVFNEGYITYSNEAKSRILGVSMETLNTYGAVSEETAREMATGAAHTASANVALSVTGIAGPLGGTEDKPVGLVYIGCSINGCVTVKKCQFNGTREENRTHTVEEALRLLIGRMTSSV